MLFFWSEMCFCSNSLDSLWLIFNLSLRFRRDYRLLKPSSSTPKYTYTLTPSFTHTHSHTFSLLTHTQSRLTHTLTHACTHANTFRSGAVICSHRTWSLLLPFALNVVCYNYVHVCLCLPWIFNIISSLERMSKKMYDSLQPCNQVIYLFMK